jgi:hypothetical protein
MHAYPRNDPRLPWLGEGAMPAGLTSYAPGVMGDQQVVSAHLCLFLSFPLH